MTFLLPVSTIASVFQNCPDDDHKLMYYTHEKKMWNNFYKASKVIIRAARTVTFTLMLSNLCMKVETRKTIIKCGISVKNYYSVSEKASLIVGCS